MSGPPNVAVSSGAAASFANIGKASSKVGEASFGATSKVGKASIACLAKVSSEGIAARVGKGAAGSAASVGKGSAAKIDVGNASCGEVWTCSSGQG